MTGDRDDMERIPNILQRLTAVEVALKHSDKMLQSSVDDIKATIRSEIADLKGEQISDLKMDLRQLHERVDVQTKRLNDIENTQLQWKTASGVVNWLIRIGIGIGGLVLGIFGSRHLGTGP